MLSLYILRLENTEVNNEKHLIALPHWRVSQILTTNSRRHLRFHFLL